ncbi:hypothetical protein HHK36_027229 [Tetracentron sinense]|uniref:Uncharacterized protein n=1 Tax=Tetracentron sinense TaxID=13715 RepID=A0A834YH76_TETSI|nr:hypothetical protein HHK36_027229 [Tetracentron sinense]
MFLTMITGERFQLIHGTIDDRLCKSANPSDTECLNINIRKLEEEAFQSPSSTTLWFLVSVLPGFLIKVSPTLSTNSEGIWASLNIFGTLGSELGELQHLQYFRLINKKLTGSIHKEFTTVSNLKVFSAEKLENFWWIPMLLFEEVVQLLGVVRQLETLIRLSEAFARSHLEL